MKKIYLNRFLKFVALIVPIILAVALMQDYIFVFRDHNTMRIHKFYTEEKNSLDVVIIGASEVTAGYSPGRAYHKYGFTSYMYAMDGNVGSLYNAQLNEILAHQSPELLIVEVFGFIQSKESLNSDAKLRTFVESIPNSENKWNTIMKFNYDDKLSCLFPFIKYHGDANVAKGQLSYLYHNHATISSPSLLKGMTTQATVHTGPGDHGVANGSNSHINDACETYLVEFLQRCQQENLKNIVFVNFPRDIQDEEHNDLLSRVENVRQIVTEYGFDFLDLQKDKALIGLDKRTDFYNSHHLNVNGQQKLTDYLGGIITDKYCLAPREQSAENQAHWQDCATFTEEYFTVCHDAILTGNNFYIGTDADLLPLLDQSTAEKMRTALSRAN